MEQQVTKSMPAGTTPPVRVCVQMLMYNVSRFILPAIENAAPFVEKIYLTWSPHPWSAYNPAARSRYRNPTPADIVDRSPWRSKLEVIRGDWANEVDQRNAALERAVADGFDVMIVQDADEFYTREDYARNVAFLSANLDCDFFRAKWYVFWKTTDYVVETFQEGLLTNCENFAVNLKRGVRFLDKRFTNGQSWRSVPGVACHLSYVYNDEEVSEKLGTWGHSHQTNRNRWFERKWLHWTPATRNLSAVNFPANFLRAVPYTGPRPAEFAMIEMPSLVIRPTPLAKQFWWGLTDWKDYLHLVLHRIAVNLLVWLRHRFGKKPEKPGPHALDRLEMT